MNYGALSAALVKQQVEKRKAPTVCQVCFEFNAYIAEDDN